MKLSIVEERERQIKEEKRKTHTHIYSRNRKGKKKERMKERERGGRESVDGRERADIESAVTSEEPAAISGGFCAPFKNANCG